MNCLYKHLWFCTRLRWCQPSICLYFFKHSSLSEASWVHIRTNILVPAHSTLPLFHQSTYKSALFIWCATFHCPHPEFVCIIFFFHLHLAESQRCCGVGMLINFEQVRPPTVPHRSLWIQVPLQHCSNTVGRFDCSTLSKTHYWFNCIAAAACWGSTPCALAGQWDSLRSTESWVWRFWRHGPH